MECVMADDTSPGWQQAVAQLNMRTADFPPGQVLTAPLSKPPDTPSHNTKRATLIATMKAVAKGLDPILSEMARRIRALEKLLGDKGFNDAPGTTTIHPAVTEYIETRLWRIERDIEAIKTDPTIMRDGDTYVEGKGYHAGQCVTFRGSLWRAKVGTDSKPGSADWRLMVKHASREP